ncbi:folate-binding protein YgfZ [Dictyocaulus viviparus]|uniref:Folate-binding protein YgfZ n=1 Tax=Dictyocaulus viviparus TaxID=29172 RepID=A0A0D8XC31_DICVI|nr:folate-binding protein YgfZ [Dictyocaulus viviparus]
MVYVPLQSRGVIVLYGPDTRDFQQGIITNDINKLDSQKAIYSLLLSPQGKNLYDFFLIAYDKYILLECENGARDMVQNSSFPLQYLIDKVNGISFDKGCYIDQEVVNRMNRQETFRRKLYLVEGNNVLSNISTKVANENNEEIGELRSSIDNIGIALLCAGKSYVNLYTSEVKIFTR